MEKKLKKAADNIKMPEDMKQRIIKAAELAEKNGVRDDSDDYIEVVRSSERVNPKRNIFRTIGAVAACAVLVGGLGTTGFLLNRKSNDHMSGSEVSRTECISCPFGDFSELEYSLDAQDGKFGEYSAETYAKLSDFLNKFNWGSELTEYETRTPEQDAEGQIYNIKWTKGDTPPIESNIHIANDGFVTYQESILGFESGAMETIESKCYKIDFDAFDSGIQAIIAQDTNNVSPFGDLSEVDFDLEVVDSKIIGYADETRAKIADFVSGFNWGKELDLESLADNDDIEFNKKYIFSWEKDKISHTLAVGDEGLALYLEMEASHENSVHRTTGGKAFWIDFEAFDRGMKEILKISDEESLFAGIIADAYAVNPFNFSMYDVTDKKIDEMTKLFNSLTWEECDCANKFKEFSFTQLTDDYFTIISGEQHTNTYIIATCDGYVCVYSETIGSDGNSDKGDKKYYTCNDASLGDKLLEAYYSDEANSAEATKKDMTYFNDAVDFLKSHDNGGLVVWLDENGGWCKQDLDQNQYDIVRNYFIGHDVKEIADNTFGMTEVKKWNDEFGLSQIQLYDSEKQEHLIIYISRDSSLIAIKKSSNSSLEDVVSIYKTEGLEALQFIRDFAE